MIILKKIRMRSLLSVDQIATSVEQFEFWLTVIAFLFLFLSLSYRPKTRFVMVRPCWPSFLISWSFGLSCKRRILSKFWFIKWAAAFWSLTRISRTTESRISWRFNSRYNSMYLRDRERRSIFSSSFDHSEQIWSNHLSGNAAAADADDVRHRCFSLLLLD